MGSRPNEKMGSGLMGAAVLVPFALWFEPGVVRQLPDMPTAAQGWLAFPCIGSTIIGQGAFAWLLQRHPIATVTPIMLLAPVLSAVIAALKKDLCSIRIDLGASPTVMEILQTAF
jgi:O-acetylserine/cysteine efflux transporter